jgi:ATP diphosphatase
MAEIDRLLAIMARLRDPESGCPWDLQQSFKTIAPYTIEEAYEVADAIARDDMEDLRDELGDLLLQVVYHAQLAQESELFRFEDIAHAICEKLVRRHPHVFEEPAGQSLEGVRRTWEETKAQERAEKRQRRGQARAGQGADPFDDIPIALPALRRAGKILGRAERSGYQAPDVLKAEDALSLLVELGHAAEQSEQRESDLTNQHGRVGDLLLLIVAWSRALGVDPERALAEQTRAYAKRMQRE